jgi:hypothetical protein
LVGHVEIMANKKGGTFKTENNILITMMRKNELVLKTDSRNYMKRIDQMFTVAFSGAGRIYEIKIINSILIRKILI